VEIESKEFLEDMKWGEENYSELMREYPDKWVAIVDKKIVGVGRSISEAEKEAYKKTGIEIKRIPVIFVERGANIY
jgi:hypothetical protein